MRLFLSDTRNSSEGFCLTGQCVRLHKRDFLTNEGPSFVTTGLLESGPGIYLLGLAPPKADILTRPITSPNDVGLGNIFKEMLFS